MKDLENNMRLTSQRQVILEELRKVKSQPTANEIYDMVRKRLPRIGLGTVYRNLDLLADRGIIKKLLSRTKAGTVLHTSNQIADYLQEKYIEFRATGCVSSSTDHTVVKQYSRKRQVKHLVNILDNIVI